MEEQKEVSCRFVLNDADYFRNEVRRHYDFLLSNGVLKYHVDEMSDNEIMWMLEKRSSGLLSWCTIGEVFETFYLNRYWCINIKQGCNIMHLTPIYFTASEKGLAWKFGHREMEELPDYYCSTVDGLQLSDPVKFFEEHIGERIFLITSQTIRHHFKENSVRYAYFFAFNDVDPEHMRRYIKRVQKDMVTKILDRPYVYAPEASFAAYVNGEFVKNTIMINENSDQIAVEVFNQEFRDIFKKRMSEIG